jgi:hypothetical protein
VDDEERHHEVEGVTDHRDRGELETPHYKARQQQLGCDGDEIQNSDRLIVIGLSQNK